MHDFRRLQVWNKSRELVRYIYSILSQFPKEENYGLSAQIKRSVISIPSNIAEGCGRNSTAQLKYFLSISTGSCFELESQIINSKDLGFISQQKCVESIDRIQEIEKMIIGLQRSIVNKK